MLSQVLRTIKGHGLLAGPTPRRVLCAVSGGPDSMALLACLWELVPRLGLELEVATVDHGLRAGAAAEALLVAERVADLGLPFHPIRVDVAAAQVRSPHRTRPPGPVGEAPPGAGEGGGGIQEVARRLRLAALADLATKRGLDRIALGHNADDQAETVLFRILRGTGLKGLRGIPYQRGPFIRPLLDVPRAQIVAYLARRSLPFATDPSNTDLRYARARLRHQILPLLRKENPRVDQALRSLATATAARFSEPPGLADVVDAGVHLPGSVLAKIRAAAAEGHGTKSFDVSGRRKVSVSYGSVRLDAPVVDVGVDAPMVDRSSALPLSRASSGASGSEIRVTASICGPGTYPLAPGLEIRVREASAPGPATARRETDVTDDHRAAHAVENRDNRIDGRVDDRVKDGWCWFDRALLSFPLIARRRRPGDRMRPRGGSGSRKLSDLLIDAKIPRHVRVALPVVTTADGELLFVPGLRPARAAAPSASTIQWIGLAVVQNADHDALVDRSIIRGNTGRYP